MLSSGQLVASRMMEGIASGSDFALLVRCSVEGDRVFLESFVGAKGLEALSRLLRRRGAVASLRCAALSSLAVAPSWMLHPDTLLETMQSPLLSPLRLDAVASSAEREDQEENITAVQERQLSLCLLVRVIESSSRERALSWLRHVQRLCRDSALLGRPAELLGHPDVGTVLAAANVLLAWLAHGDQQQQTAAKRELLLLGAHEEVRRMVRHELLGPTMRQLLLQIRANASDDHQASSVVLNEKVIVLNHQETVEQLEHRLGTGRLLFSGCVPQSGVFCRPDMVLRGALLRCERWPLPWKMCIVGHGGILEQSCRIDSRMTGDRAVAYIATCHLDEWDNYRLKVKNGRWIDGKLTLAAQCSDGDTLELKIPPSSFRLEIAGEPDAREVSLLLSHTVEDVLQAVGYPDLGCWMRPIGGESGQKKRWLERDQTLGEAGVDMHVLRCEARPRLLLLIDEESGDRTIEVMEHDLASKVVSRVGGGGGNHQLFRKGRPDLPVFGWATLSEQGIPPGVPLLVKKQQGFPAAYATSLNAPFLSDDKHAEEDLHWENKAPSNDGSRLLEAASLNALVVLMTGGGSVHQIQMILLTLASFTSSAQVVRLLIQRGRGADSSVIIRVLKVMKQWLDVDHFLEDQIVSAIVTFLDRDVPTDLKAPQQTLRNALLRWARGDTRMYKIRDPPPPPLVAGSKQMRLRDWDPLEVARQITLPVFAVYSRIEARELFSQPWNSPKTQHRCPNVMKMISSYNHLAQCVATSIVLSGTVRRRVKMINHWLEIALALQQLQNYHSLSAIVSGLGNASVLRLRHTKEALSKKQQKIQSELSDLCSMSGSFKNLREAVNKGDPPKVPYIGIYLSDFVFIEDGNPNTVMRKRPSSGEEVELIYMAKRQLFYKIVSTIQTWQLVPYNLVAVEQLQSFLADMQVMDDKQLFAESLLREPRE